MCKYNNQVNMNRLFCQALSTLSIYSLYHCATFLCSSRGIFRFSFRWGECLSGERMNGQTVGWLFGVFSVLFYFSYAHTIHICNCSSGIRVLLSLALLLLWLNFIVFGHRKNRLSDVKPVLLLLLQALRLKRKLFFFFKFAYQCQGEIPPDCKTGIEKREKKLNFITCQLQKYAYNLTFWTVHPYSYNLCAFSYSPVMHFFIHSLSYSLFFFIPFSISIDGAVSILSFLTLQLILIYRSYLIFSSYLPWSSIL